MNSNDTGNNENILRIEPQPELIKNSDGAWWYNEEPYLSNDAMESHLFHDVYGDRLGNSTVFDECYPVLIDGVWYWQAS
jgi:hypothetical protein